MSATPERTRKLLECATVQYAGKHFGFTSRHISFSVYIYLRLICIGDNALRGMHPLFHEYTKQRYVYRERERERERERTESKREREKEKERGEDSRGPHTVMAFMSHFQAERSSKFISHGRCIYSRALAHVHQRALIRASRECRE